MISRCLTRTRGFIARLFHHHNLSVCSYSTGILGQRNLALGLRSSTEVPQQFRRTSCKYARVTHSDIHTVYTEERRSSPGSGHRSKRSGRKGTVRLQRVIKRSLQLQQQPQSANSPTFTRTAQIHNLIDCDISTYFL